LTACRDHHFKGTTEVKGREIPKGSASGGKILGERRSEHATYMTSQTAVAWMLPLLLSPHPAAVRSHCCGTVRGNQNFLASNDRAERNEFTNGWSDMIVSVHDLNTVTAFVTVDLPLTREWDFIGDIFQFKAVN